MDQALTLDQHVMFDSGLRPIVSQAEMEMLIQHPFV